MKKYILKKEDDYYDIVDSSTGIHIIYSMIDEENLDFAKEVIKVLNNLDYELKGLENKLNQCEYYHSLDKQDLIVQNKRLRAMVNYDRGMKDLEFKYCKEVLDGVLKDYPKSKGLLEFKQIMDW